MCAESAIPVVSYEDIPGAPGRYFRCARMSGDPLLSDTSCAENYRRAAAVARDSHDAVRLHSCRGCPIGALHAGVEHVEQTRFQKSRECSRCGQFTMRMIQGRLCVSCVNRQYELVKGRNAKGTMPTKLKPIHHRKVLVHADGHASEKSWISVDNEEIILSALRTQSGRVLIGFRGEVQKDLLQMTLF